MRGHAHQQPMQQHTRRRLKARSKSPSWPLRRETMAGDIRSNNPGIEGPRSEEQHVAVFEACWAWGYVEHDYARTGGWLPRA